MADALGAQQGANYSDDLGIQLASGLAPHGQEGATLVGVVGS
jgi:hypothetical protein